MDKKRPLPRTNLEIDMGSGVTMTSNENEFAVEGGTNVA
jgi:hypothetical protein